MKKIEKREKEILLALLTVWYIFDFQLIPCKIILSKDIRIYSAFPLCFI